MRVGITNQKGGVAKTTNTINVAGALAELGYDVLAGDLDPQGYLTNRLGLREAYTAEDATTLYDGLTEPHDHAVEDIIVSHPEFDVLPSHVDMFRAEQDLIAAGWKPRERLQLLLRDFDGYDAIVIDAPPSLGPINDNVLLTTENILVPVEADHMMQLALDHLLNQINSLEKRYETDITERGILVSNVNYPLDNEQKEVIEWFESFFDGRCPVYEIRHRAAIKRSIKQEGSIFAPDAEETDQRDTYLTIAQELMNDG